MDLFQAIFAESSSDESDVVSSNTEAKTEIPQVNLPSTNGSSHHTAAASRESYISSKQMSLQRTQWQDLSVLTTKLPVSTNTRVSTVDKNTAETLPESRYNITVGSPVGCKHQRSQQEIGISAREKERIVDTFGPKLPPGIDCSLFPVIC